MHVVLYVPWQPLKARDSLAQGSCKESDPVVDLGLERGEADEMIALKSAQCIVLIDETWMMVNNGTLWLDNLYVKVSRQKAVPGLAFITAGLRFEVGIVQSAAGTAAGSVDAPIVHEFVLGSQIFITDLTFHSERERNAVAVTLETQSASVSISGAFRSGPARRGVGIRSCIM